MSSYLLQLAIGPVQEFIAAARRTRDLWFGSYLLSEISKAAALAVRQHGGKLIFPATGADLTPGSPLNVANIILAEVHGHDPKTLAAAAREAAELCWMQFADAVRQSYQSVIRPEIWQDQVGDVVEFYAAWVPLTEKPYKTQRERLARLMAGRKNCRDFLPGKGLVGVPKSSLDGLRESVLKDDDVEKWPARTRRRLRVRPGEQLDVVGLVKRTALELNRVGKRPFPSVARIAADPWLRGIVKAEAGALRDLCSVCDEMVSKEFLNAVDDRDFSQYAAFPFEGTAVYRNRHRELRDETLDQEDDPTPYVNRLGTILQAVEGIAKKAGLGSEPDPYVVVLVADGDHMGKAISALTSPDEHRLFSRHLAEFATAARTIVADHHGVLVYSGGDDVLAFVPQDQALQSARALHTAFHQTMLNALPDRDAKDLPTLSVGLAIAHFLENLEDLLAYGRAAEKAAKKPDRDGLAVHLHKRGGAPVTIRERWTMDLDYHLIEYARWFLAEAMSHRTPYELHQLADVYDGWPEATRAVAIKADACRIIDRKRPTGTDSQMVQIRNTIEAVVIDAKTLRALADRLLVARQLAIALRQCGNKESTTP